MNVRTITSLLLAPALMATTAGVYAAQQLGRDSVSPDARNSATSTASSSQITPFGRDSVYVTKDSILSTPSVVNSAALGIKSGRS